MKALIGRHKVAAVVLLVALWLGSAVLGQVQHAHPAVRGMAEASAGLVVPGPAWEPLHRFPPASGSSGSGHHLAAAVVLRHLVHPRLYRHRFGVRRLLPWWLRRG